MYNKINLVHIPKTAGWYIREELLDYVLDPLREKGVNYLEIKDHYHTGWTLVDDQTYSISSWRDPVRRLASHFIYLIGLRDYYYLAYHSDDYQNKQLALSVVNNTKQVWNYYPTIKSFLEWIEDNKEYLKNYQAKNIMLNHDINDHQIFWDDVHFDLVGKGLKKEQVYFRLGRLNIFLKDTQLNIPNMLLLRNKIKTDFNLKSVEQKNNYWGSTMSVSPWNDGHNIFPPCQELYDDLSQKQKDYIYNFNDIDTEIYNDYSLFWNNGL